VQATLDFLDRDHTGTVDVEEFVAAMDKLTFHVKDAQLLDNLIASMLEGRKVGVRVASAQL
jgi:Ca2+-binding EF-hand superfamily protein